VDRTGQTESLGLNDVVSMVKAENAPGHWSITTKDDQRRNATLEGLSIEVSDDSFVDVKADDLLGSHRLAPRHLSWRSRRATMPCRSLTASR